MATYLIKILMLIAAVLSVKTIQGQELMGPPAPVQTPTLLVCKQTGKYTLLKGSDSKTTDRYERGTVKIETQGPIKYELDPNDFSIGPNQKKTWSATVYPDVAKSPAPGNCGSAFIIAHFDVVYSRPRGRGTAGAIIGSYSCDGCYAHAPPGGVHDIVNNVGDVTQMLSICSIDVQVRNVACDDKVITLHADIFPAGGNLTWDTPFGPFAGNDVKVANPQNLIGFKVTATYTIQGLTITDTKTVERNKITRVILPCCSDKALNVKDVANVQFDGPCKSDVVFSPAVLNIPWTPTWTEKVIATANGISKATTIQMVNTKAKVGGQIPELERIKVGLKKAMKEYRNAMLAIAVAGGVGACESKGNYEPKLNIGADLSYVCCPPDADGCVKLKKKFFGEAKWSYGKTCHFPFYGIPKIASLDFVYSVGASVTISFSGQDSCGTPVLCTGVDGKVSVGGGMGTTVAAGLISADLQLVCDAFGISGEICFYPAFRACSTYTFGKLRIVGTAVLAWGLTSLSVDYTLYNGYAVGPTCW